MARANIILDSSVVIDLFVDLPEAIKWSYQVRHLRIAIASVTVMEVLRGARNRQEMSTLGRKLAQFEVVHCLKQDSEWAVRQFRVFWLSHKIGINDCLISAIAARTQLPIYTLNVKDFVPLPDVQVIKPY